VSNQDAAVSRARDDTEGLTLKIVGEAEMPAVRAFIASVPLPKTDPLAAGDGPVESLWLER